MYIPRRMRFPRLKAHHIVSGEFRSVSRQFDGHRSFRYHSFAGWSSLVARRAHNPKVVGSNPTPATMGTYEDKPLSALLIYSYELSRNNLLA